MRGGAPGEEYDPASDPLMRLAGSLTSGDPDWVDRHDAYLAAGDPLAPYIGAFHSGVPDLAARHDEHLALAAMAPHREE